AERQMRAHHAAILERHPVGAGELQVGNGFGGLGAAADRLGKARLVKLRQAGAPRAGEGGGSWRGRPPRRRKTDPRRSRRTARNRQGGAPCERARRTSGAWPGTVPAAGRTSASRS